jgi:hypothetical protein
LSTIYLGLIFPSNRPHAVAALPVVAMERGGRVWSEGEKKIEQKNDDYRTNHSTGGLKLS